MLLLSCFYCSGFGRENRHREVEWLQGDGGEGGLTTYLTDECRPYGARKSLVDKPRAYALS